MIEKFERSKWPDDTASRIETMRAAGQPWRVVAEGFGVNAGTIRIQAKKLGVFRPSSRYFAAAEDEVIRHDYVTHANLRETAAKLGRSYGDIRQRIFLFHRDLVGTVRTGASTKAIMKYGRGVLELGATPAEAVAACKAKIVEAEAAARVAALHAKAKHNSQIVDLMLSQISQGKDRNAAIFEARALGVTLEQIGGCFEITRERVRQICDAEAFRVVMSSIAQEAPHSAEPAA